MNEKQAELIQTRPGARLMHERKARGLTVSDVAAKIHIRERIIRALETDDTDWIAPVYLKGYVKAYAIEMGLDPAVLEAEANTGITAEPELRSVFNIDPKRGFAERWLKSGSYLVATALIAALVWQVTQQAVQFSQGTTSLTGESAISSELEQGAGTSAPSDVGGRQNSHLAASIASLEKLRSPSVDNSSAAEQAWSAMAAPAAEKPMISITVSADSWVEITDSEGKLIEKDLLRGGNQRSYHGAPPFEMLLGRPAAVLVEFNGEPVDLAPHIHGDVARLTLGAAEQPTP